ncbi:MAG: hypothetical protein IJ808_09075 [Muribaculaceae bacterium]|nr:hypothetical protein [Muribaculaceae bacterium]
MMKRLWKRPETHTSVKADFFAFLKKYNSVPRKVETENGATHVYFDFQGGHFVAQIKRDDLGVDITYPGFLEAPLDELQEVRSMCNHFNARSLALKFVYAHNEEDNRLNVHLSFFVNVVQEKALLNLFNACFYFQREFCDDYHSLIDAKKKQSEDDKEAQQLRLNRELFLLREQELRHQTGDTAQYRRGVEHTLLLDEFVRTVVELDAVTYKSLTVAVGDAVKTLTDTKLVAQYDLLGALIEHNGEQVSCAHDDATLTLRYATVTDAETERMMIVLNHEGDDGKTIWLRLTACRVPRNIGHDESLDSEPAEAESVSVLVAYERATDAQRQSEADYMWKDAKIKLRNGESLTEEEQLIADATNANEAYCLYHGRRLMLEGRYYEAIRLFENAFSAMLTDYFNLNEKERGIFGDVCYHLGFCYNELHLYRRAFYYLSLLRDDGNVRHASELINALSNGKDLRVFSLTDDIMKNISQQFDKEEDLPEYLQSFVNFMRRRRAYSLIDFHQLDEAEKAFTDMLDEPENADYAISELAYIKQLREQERDDQNP